MTNIIKTGKATPLTGNEHEIDVKTEVSPINPKASTKTNEEMLEGLEKFNPLEISESGKNVYSIEHKNRILDQLSELLVAGHNLTMVKKALAVHHNINTGTLDKWRKSAGDGSSHSQSGMKVLSSTDSEYIKVVQNKLDNVLRELRSLEAQVIEAKDIISNHNKLI